MLLPRPFRLMVVAGLAAGLVSTAALGAEFTEGLTPEQKTSSGVAKLSDAQVSTLNNLVEREILLARQGGVTAFSGEFSNRRSLPERAKAGLDKLSVEERAALDTLVAQAIANRPVDAPNYVSAPSVGETAVRGIGPKAHLHGTASFVVGGGSGGSSFYGGSVMVEHHDPAKGFSVAVGYATLRGDGLWGYYPYGYRYGRYPYYDPLYRW